MIKNYVKYRDESENPFINQFTKLSAEVQRLIRNKDDSFVVEPFYSLANYKNVRNLAELDASLPSNETLVIEIADKDLDKVNIDHVFTDETLKKNTESVILKKKEKIAKLKKRIEEAKANKERTINSDIGKVAYLLPFDYATGCLPKKVQLTLSPSVLLKKPVNETGEELYMLQPIVAVTDSIGQRRSHLENSYGGYSDLYYEITDPKIAELYEVDVMELTKVGPQSWVITKVPEYLQAAPSK